MQEVQMQDLEKHVNFETENSRKAYCREFKKVLFSVVTCFDNPIYFTFNMNHIWWPILNNSLLFDSFYTR